MEPIILNPNCKMIFVAGVEVWNAEAQAQIDTVPRSRIAGQDCFDSEALCRFQLSQANKGIIAAILVKSIYGWTVRYDSGLQDFAIIAGTRSGQLDGSLEDAERYAREWCARDPERRYAYRRES
jgi:hypothetical protein